VVLRVLTGLRYTKCCCWAFLGRTKGHNLSLDNSAIPAASVLAEAVLTFYGFANGFSRFGSRGSTYLRAEEGEYGVLHSFRLIGG
jgi:hypothetical protein